MRRTNLLCITSMIVVIDLTMQLIKILNQQKRLLHQKMAKSTEHLIMEITMLRIIKCVELCSVTKNTDDISIKSGV